MDADLTSFTIGGLAPLLQDRQLSPLEVTRAYLTRIERLNPQLSAYTTITADDALLQAGKAEREIGRGHYRGPLHGVPIGLKDLLDVSGVGTTFGSRILQENPATQDATVTARLREAGAVFLGKHNLHEFAYGVTGENPHLGTARNPWDPSRVTGGSSSGTASAVGARLCAAGIGSDTGGSIRIPAAFCGLVGLKPTYGRVSRAGALPLSWSLDHLGPLARSVEDAALMLQAIAGPDPRDLAAADEPVPNYSAALRQDLSQLRLGIPREYFSDLLDTAVQESVQRAIDHLQRLGARLEEVSLPNVVHSQLVGGCIIGVEAARWHQTWLRERPRDYGADVLLRLRTGALVLAVDYLKAQQVRALIQADFTGAFAQVDAIVSPTIPIVAPEIGTTFDPLPGLQVSARSLIGRLTMPGNLAGLPSITVPCGFVRDLPIGLQVMGPAFGETLILRVAYAYEQSTEWHLRQPAAFSS